MFRLMSIFLVFLLTISAWSQNTYKVYFNEIRANDNGNDNIEFIELIGPANTDLTGFWIAHYNGSSGIQGTIWTHSINFTIQNDGIIDNNGNPLGIYVYGSDHAQLSGIVDETWSNTDNLLDVTAGLVLYDASNNIIDAVAWLSSGDLTSEAALTASPPTNADNYLAVITVGDDGSDNSMEAPNNILGDDGSGWVNNSATPGVINSSQTSGDVALPVTLSSFSAIINKNKVILEWTTESEVNNLGFEILRSTQNQDNFVLISSYQYNPDLQGQGNTNNRTEYSFIDNSIDENLAYWYKLVDVDFNGNRTEHGPISANLNTNTIGDFRLHQNFPNPFNPNTTIQFEIPPEVENQHVVLSIYNQLGENVVTLFKGTAESGSHLVNWDGTNRFGRKLSSGVYIYTLQSENFVSSMKMVLLK